MEGQIGQMMTGRPTGTASNHEQEDKSLQPLVSRPSASSKEYFHTFSA
jgi:hypothetical protein